MARPDGVKLPKRHPVLTRQDKGGLYERVSILFFSAVGFLAMHAVPAAASVTIGQVADPNAGNCDAGTEFVQLGVASGNPYVVPGNGTITSWTVQAGGDPGRLTMKIFAAR